MFICMHFKRGMKFNVDVRYTFPRFPESARTLIKNYHCQLDISDINNDIALTALLHLFENKVCYCTMPIYS